MLFRYFINYRDETTKEDCYDHGMASGQNYTEAAARVLEYYGDKCGDTIIWDFRMYMTEDVLCADELMGMPEEQPEKFLRG